ncbi:GFA family protein [Cronobacter muytjensii]|uniref:GFA family protein n=1 Tax=Cronobacter TaxID=413496 RepID=UPI0012A126BB|nr:MULTISPECIES: GFA family protein [Cronobacter]EKS1844698.1 GFA family protein [Cronobacter muytjensii]ELY4673101.1 GFA family protein [Cronobacter muytjensii]ELY6223492.1 GFA family protein [Cronobacter muytjensii]ELY6345531.1 GFA family protein [Cronobacter muytjensii]NCH56359.1 GFA family protein [Cronobacter muytjensii]
MNKMNGQCHCGAVKFTVELTDGLNTARRCNCSYCRMRGAVVVSAPLTGITVLEGKEKLTEYRFNTRQAAHYFCSVCGIYTFHQRRSNPDQYGVNVACLEGISPFDFPEITVTEGIHHPNDGGGGVAGYLRYTRAKPGE